MCVDTKRAFLSFKIGGKNMSRSQRWSTAVILIALVVFTTAGQSRREAKEELDKGLQSHGQRKLRRRN